MKQNDTLDVLNKNISNQTIKNEDEYFYINEIYNSKSLRKRKNLLSMISLTEKKNVIHVKVGISHEERFETIYNFYVDMKTKEIKFMTFNGDLVLFDKKLDLDKLDLLE